MTELIPLFAGAVTILFGIAFYFALQEFKNMIEEFDQYGLPKWSVGIIGFLKVSLAFFLILSIWFPALETSVLTAIGILMIGAIGMHIKIGDAYSKSIPAFLLLSLTLAVYLL